MQIRLTLEYDGTAYCGWQRQAADDSIQARIEGALSRLFAEPVTLRAAGRTDAGVHALGQVAAFRLPRPFPVAGLVRALNALLPADIVVRSAAETSDAFDPRRHASSRVYEYRILNQPMRSAFNFRFAWLVCQPLEIAPMNEAAHCFVGEHDFTAFRSVGSQERTTVRRVLASEWRQNGSVLTYHVEATGFLRRMVRTMVASMVGVGRGANVPGYINELLAAGERRLAPAAAPAGGLYLIEVRY